MSTLRIGAVQRTLFPSIADLLFTGLLFTRLQSTLFHDGDTGWHLWAGKASLGQGPGALLDSLSFTRSGVPWDNVEWIGEALFALLFQHGGYLGVAVLCGVVFAGTFSWMYRILLRVSSDPPVALLITALAAQVTLIQFLARPLIFSFPLFLGLVQCARGPNPGRRALILAPVITLVWANIHPSAYLAPAILFFFWLFGSRDRFLGFATVFSLAALGATPWGFSWIPNMVMENRSYFGRVEEWASPQFGELRFLPYLLYLLLALAARRGGKPLSIGETIWGLGWMGAALISARLGPYAVMAWAPWLARDLAGAGWSRSSWFLGRAWRGARDTLGPMETALRPRLWPVLVGLGALIAAPQLVPRFPEVAEGFPGDRFPREAIAEADRLGLGPRVFNRYAWGGFISWETEGRYKTFIDGRAGFFGPELLEEYLEVMALGPGWNDVLAKHRPDWLLVAPGSALVTALEASEAWDVPYRDETAVILIPGSSNSGLPPPGSQTH